MELRAGHPNPEARIAFKPVSFTEIPTLPSLRRLSTAEVGSSGLVEHSAVRRTALIDNCRWDRGCRLILLAAL